MEKLLEDDDDDNEHEGAWYGNIAKQQFCQSCKMGLSSSIYCSFDTIAIGGRNKLAINWIGWQRGRRPNRVGARLYSSCLTALCSLCVGWKR